MREFEGVEGVYCGGKSYGCKSDCYFLFFACYWIFILFNTEEYLPVVEMFIACPATDGFFIPCSLFDINMLIRVLFEE